MKKLLFLLPLAIFVACSAPTTASIDGSGTKPPVGSGGYWEKIYVGQVNGTMPGEKVYVAVRFSKKNGMRVQYGFSADITGQNNISKEEAMENMEKSTPRLYGIFNEFFVPKNGALYERFGFEHLNDATFAFWNFTGTGRPDGRDPANWEKMGVLKLEK